MQTGEEDRKEVSNGSGELRKVKGGRLDWGSKEKEFEGHNLMAKG